MSMQIAESSLEELWFGLDNPEQLGIKAAQSLAAATAAAKGLRSFPAAAMRAMQLLSNPDASIAEIDKVIGQDPALASQLLRVANSALYRPVTPIGEVRDAVMRLGMKTVHDIVAGVATMGMFQDKKGVGAGFRRHSVGTAAIMRVLTTEWGKASRVPSAFLAGLLHDVGKLLSVQVGEITYDAMPPEALTGADRVHLIERETVGYDHAVLGAHVLDHWRMPEIVVRATAFHHEPGSAFAEDGEVGLYVAILRMADAIDYCLAASESLDEAFVAQLTSGIEAQYAGFDATILSAMWPKLATARSELAGQLGA